MEIKSKLRCSGKSFSLFLGIGVLFTKCMFFKVSKFTRFGAILCRASNFYSCIVSIELILPFLPKDLKRPSNPLFLSNESSFGFWLKFFERLLIGFVYMFNFYCLETIAATMLEFREEYLFVGERLALRAFGLGWTYYFFNFRSLL